MDLASLANTMMVDVRVIDLGGRFSWGSTRGSTPSLRMIVLHEHECLYDHHLVYGVKLILLKKQRKSELAPRLWVATSDLWKQ